MKDLNVKYLGHTVGSGIISVNGKKKYITSNYAILSHCYNEMFDENLSFNDIIKKKVKNTSDKRFLNELYSLVEERLNQMSPPPISTEDGSKWDGYTQI